jgi:hypothetical protein
MIRWMKLDGLRFRAFAVYELPLAVYDVLYLNVLH